MAEGDKFERTLLKIIDDVLVEVFSENAASIIYGYLEKNYYLKRQNITRNLHDFIKGLNEFLGSGARMIQIMILKELYSNFGFKFEQVNERRDFVDYVNELRYKLESLPKNGS